MAERHIRTVEWLPAESAPIGERVLICGGGPTRIALRDALGNWRQLWGGAYKTPPKFWMPIPDLPEDVGNG